MMPATKISGHWRTIRLRDGRVVRFFVKEHVRTGKGHHRLTSEVHVPEFQREMIDRWRDQAEEASSGGPSNPADVVSPEEIGAGSYMEHQRRLIHRMRRHR